MVKHIHNITITIFEKNNEKIDDHKDILKFLLPVDFEKEHVDLSIESAEGFGQEMIQIIRLKTDKKRHNVLLLDNIFSHLSEEDKKLIGDQYLSRLNEEGYFFIRLDKSQLMKKKFILIESGNCYHFKIKIAGFPARWEEFEKSTKSLLINYNCLKKDDN